MAVAVAVEVALLEEMDDTGNNCTQSFEHDEP